MTGNLILSQITCNFKIIRSTGKFPVSRTKEVTATYRNLPVCAFNTELVHKHLNNVHTYLPKYCFTSDASNDAMQTSSIRSEAVLK